MRRMMRYIALTAGMLLAGTWTVMHGQTPCGYPVNPGCLDTTFGNGGKAAINLSPQNLGSVATQRVSIGQGAFEDRVIAVNSNLGWTIARHLPNGALDPSFGVGGVITKTFKKGSGALYGDVIVQPDKFLVAGSVPTGSSAVSTFAVARYTANGTPDTSFGTAGLVSVPLSASQSLARGVAVQPDGKIVAVGDTCPPGDSCYLKAVRFTTNGQLDTTFGTGGVFSYNHNGLTTSGSNVAIQAVEVGAGSWEQRIVLTSHVFCCYPVVGSALVIRLNQLGQLDTTFGSGGMTEVSLARDTYFDDMVIDSNSRIVAGGHISYGDPSLSDLLLARLGADGTLDSSFGNGGTFSTRWQGGNSALASVALQPDGKILAVGTNPSAIWRFLADGIPDYGGFGSNGWVLVSAEGTTPFPFFNDITLVRRPDGANAFVVGGKSTEQGRGGKISSFWTLWRFLY